MRPVAAGGVAWSVCLSVCLSVCHDRESCKNGWTDRDTVWIVDSGGPNELRIRWEYRSPSARRQFWEGKGAAHCKVQGLSVVNCAKTAEPSEIPFGLCTRLEPRKHVLDGLHTGATWTVHLRRRCGLMSNYFDHLFYLISVGVGAWDVSRSNSHTLYYTDMTSSCLLGHVKNILGAAVNNSWSSYNINNRKR